MLARIHRPISLYSLHTFGYHNYINLYLFDPLHPPIEPVSHKSDTIILLSCLYRASGIGYSSNPLILAPLRGTSGGLHSIKLQSLIALKTGELAFVKRANAFRNKALWPIVMTGLRVMPSDCLYY